MNTYTYEELEDYFEEYLSELYDDVNVCGYMCQSGSLLRRIDPIAFRTGMSDWMDTSDYREVKIDDEWVYTLEE